MSDIFEQYAEIIVAKVGALEVPSSEKMRITGELSNCFNKIKSRSAIYLESMADMEVEDAEGGETFKFDELVAPELSNTKLLSEQIAEFNIAVLKHAAAQRADKTIQTSSDRANLTSALQRAYMISVSFKI